MLHGMKPAKVFSARGLDNYLKGAAALKNLGKGD